MRAARSILPFAAALLAAHLGGCATTTVDGAPVDTRHVDGKAEPLTLDDAKDERQVTTAAEGLQKGDAAYAAGKSEDAVYFYLQAARLEPTAAAPLLRVAAIQESRRNVPLAIKAYEMALAREPNNPDAVEHLGLLLVQAGSDERARALLQGAADQGSDRWRVHDALGLLADRRGDREAAARHYAAALAIAPRSPSVLNNRGYSRLLAADYAGAEADFRESLRLAPMQQARLNLGTAIGRQRRYDEAHDTFAAALEAHEALYRVGDLALQNGDLVIARDYLDRAMRASPMYFEKAYLALQTANRGTVTPAAPAAH